jgi:uncharacterized protein (DUF924 family)
MPKFILISLFLVFLLAGCATNSQPATTVSSEVYAFQPKTVVSAEPNQKEKQRWLAETDSKAIDVLTYWFEEWDQDMGQGGKGRYNDKWFPHGPKGAAGSKEVDKEIRKRFLGLFDDAVNNRLDWDVQSNPYENLAYILLIDQMARNMFRGTPQAYEHDQKALAAAKNNVQQGLNRYYFTGYQRLFVVYPLMHDETLASQAMCLYLLKTINESENYPYQFLNAMQKGVEHYQMVFMFNRFPHRNVRLGRMNTSDEKSYLKMKDTQGFVDGSKW